jgi:hypothetical protein
MKTRIFIGFLIVIIWGAGSLFTGCKGKVKNQSPDKVYKRGIVVFPSDIISLGTPKFMEFLRESDLNLLGIHANTISRNPTNTGFEDLSCLKAFLKSKEGQLLLYECEKQRIEIEYETHALQEILPRELFNEHPEFFRMDENGVRQKDHNMCFSSEDAFLEIGKNIVEIVKWLKPMTHRYFFWTDDVNNAYCHCDLCKKYSESEQALLYENRLLTILRKIDPSATLAHLAYSNTLEAPVKVKPSDGIFLEYAPSRSDYTKPLLEENIQNLETNLRIFPKKTAHILEYWLDVSRFSGYRRINLTKIPWDIQNFDKDIKSLFDLGITSVTCFGTWMICDDYLKKFGEESTNQVIIEYGSALKKYLK